MRGTRQGVSIMWSGCGHRIRLGTQAPVGRSPQQRVCGAAPARATRSGSATTSRTARSVPEVERSDGLTRFGAAVSEAADEAIDNALDRGWRPGPVVGVIHALVLGEVEPVHEFYLERNCRLKSHEYLHLMPSTVLSLLMQRHDFHGPVMNVTAMCASGNAAMLTAKMWLDAGVASDVDRRRERPLGHTREHPPLPQPRRGVPRRARARDLPAVPGGLEGLRRRRGVGRHGRSRVGTRARTSACSAAR